LLVKIHARPKKKLNGTRKPLVPVNT
jgi:hypothetical protein